MRMLFINKLAAINTVNGLHVNRPLSPYRNMTGSLLVDISVLCLEFFVMATFISSECICDACLTVTTFN